MWTPHWRREGCEPDYRFSLANERTFLAWIRTSIALLASGVVLEQFATRIGPPGIAVALAWARPLRRRFSLYWHTCDGEPMKPR